MAKFEDIPDNVKLAGSTGPALISIMGVPIEQWMYVASAIVSVMFIIEKMPVVSKRIVSFVKLVRDLYVKYKEYRKTKGS